MDTHYETHTSTFRAVVGRPPMAFDPTAARNFLITPLEAMMNEDVQALVLIIYFVANISCSTMFTGRVFRVRRLNAR